jgi:hypothetical protein
MELLAQTCADCSHLYRRHMHASLRRGGLMKMAGVKFHVDPPPRDSRLGQLLVELGLYDSYWWEIRRDPPGSGENA